MGGTQVKAGDPQAIFPDRPQVLFRTLASSLEKGYKSVPDYSCMAFLWHQRRQSRKSCRCRDGLAQWELQETPRKFVPPPPGRCAEQCPSPPGFHLWEPSSSLGFQPRGPELLPPLSRPEEAEGSPGPYTRYRLLPISENIGILRSLS